MAATEHDLIPTHVTSVVGAERIGPGFVRVTFGGGLERFRPVGPDQFVYVLVPPPGRAELVIGTDFRWTDYEELPEVDRPVGAYYTVRHHRPEVGELDCDVFLHEPAGHASTWAASAAAGAPAALWGPRTAWDPPQGTTRWLLVADETGVPAVAAVLESLPAGADVTVLLELSDARDAGPVGGTRLLRTGRPAGTTDLLVDAVRSLDLDPVGLYAWGGAEGRAMRDVRRHLRATVGLTREQVSMTPYWRHARHADDVEDDGEDDGEGRGRSAQEDRGELGVGGDHVVALRRGLGGVVADAGVADGGHAHGPGPGDVGAADVADVGGPVGGHPAEAVEGVLEDDR